ncbi:hypothetical protein HRG84_21040 [Flavisolibacter sp. BT320]|nr:hypothetical protein [Flavisolibacter longurius]
MILFWFIDFKIIPFYLLADCFQQNFSFLFPATVTLFSIRCVAHLYGWEFYSAFLFNRRDAENTNRRCETLCVLSFSAVQNSSIPTGPVDNGVVAFLPRCGSYGADVFPTTILSYLNRFLSNVKRQTSNVKRQTSNVKRQTSNVKRQTSNVKRQTSNVKRQTIGKELQTTNH